MPNCMMRGSPVIVVIRPNVPAEKLLFGNPQLKVLNRLNTSSRSAIVRVAAKDTRRDSTRSTLWKPGPLMLLRALAPNPPGAGCANVAGLRTLFNVFAPYTSFETWSAALVGHAVERVVAAAQDRHPRAGARVEDTRNAPV